MSSPESTPFPSLKAPDYQAFLDAHQLPNDYLAFARANFLEMAEDLAARATESKQALVLGINGAQGSGKSTLADFLAVHLFAEYQLNSVVISLDDYYLSKAARAQLAKDIHPLLATRGVPGTHDIDALLGVVGQLVKHDFPVSIQRFNKAEDDVADRALWTQLKEPVDVVILEGWCLGAAPQTAQDLLAPINPLEALDDVGGQWRTWVNQQLASSYQDLFDGVDLWVMLAAPSFDCVKDWRWQQEQKLMAQVVSSGSSIMTYDAIERFTQYFQRITQHLLVHLPKRVDYLYQLDAQRAIVDKVSPSLVVFTDLDGTLLDHYSYSFEPAREAMGILASKGIELILCTSKTKTEVLALRNALANQSPFIVENGAAVYLPKSLAIPADLLAEAELIDDGDYWLKRFIEPRAHWLSLLDSIKFEPAFAGAFIGFNDMSVEEIAEDTGLSLDEASRAKQREFGEPLKWLGDACTKQAFIQQMHLIGAGILEGGRYIHISGDCDKGKALQWSSDFLAKYNSRPMQSIAAGDSGNDIAMLESADYALLVKSPVHDFPQLKRAQASSLYFSNALGPSGWNEGIRYYLDTLLISSA